LLPAVGGRTRSSTTTRPVVIGPAALRRLQRRIPLGEFGKALVVRPFFREILLDDRRAVLAFEALRPGIRRTD
jgi:hypothetical protein